MADPFNPYDVLGVQRDADALTIKAAYRRKSKQLHPDRNKNPDAAAQMALVNRAEAILMDPERRRHFDTTGQADLPPSLEQRAKMDTRAAIAQFLETHGPEVDVLAVMQQQIRAGNDELRRKAAAADRKIAQLQQRRDYVRRRDRNEEGNLFTQVIGDLLARAEAEKASIEERLQLNLAALELLKEYEFEGPKVQPTHARPATLAGLFAAASDSSIA